MSLRVGVSSQMLVSECERVDSVGPTESIKGIMKMCVASLTVVQCLGVKNIMAAIISSPSQRDTSHIIPHKQDIVNSI